MPIEILDFPEPLTPRARESLSPPVLIKSKAYDQLLYELRRYCDGQTSGRSFLIAGHRGSGKTTLVLSALQELLPESERGYLRPLNIQLLGPSLLPDLNEKDLAEPGKGAASGEKKLTEFENVLVQITLALYRAVVREFTSAYEERMAAASFGVLSDAPSRARLLEASGQLVLELDEYPGKARLREVWRRSGALPDGLWSGEEITNPRPHQLGQGVRELVALASVSEAYRRISGTIQAKTEAKSGEEATTTKTAELDLKGKDLFGPLITVLTGGAVATGVAALKPGEIGLAALAGVLTALVSAIAGKRSSSQSRKRSASSEDLFLPDLSVATLDRVLPVLLERVRAAGLAPIFIIDELDKVADLSARIPQMVKRLKKLVAESAFFCFLTDRRYFEEMRARNVVTPYSVEYTYFTNYVFVTFAHTDLHAYLAQVLKKPESTIASPMSPEALKLARDLNEEIADHAVLPYVLLHAAQMHPIDLRRQLGEIRGADKAVALSIGSVRSLKSRRLELLIQVAIELLLEEKDMEEELATDPAFRRLAHDALYFLSRQWENVADIGFDDIGRKKFCDYLVDRMKTEWEDGKAAPPKGCEVEKHEDAAPKTKEADAKSEEQAKGESEAEPDPAGESDTTATTPFAPPPIHPSFNREQTDFLWSYVRQLALLLKNPVEVRARALTKTGRFAAPVLDTLKVEDLGPLLEQDPASPDLFRWRYNRAGRLIAKLPRPIPPKAEPLEPPSPTERSLRPPAPEVLPATPPDPLHLIALIEKFNTLLANQTGNTVTFGTLGTGFGVISTSPAWPSVLEAIQRLKTNSSEYPQRGDDIFIVEQFFDLLNRNMRLIGWALFGGWLLGQLCPQSGDTNQVFAGLQILSEMLSLKSLPEEEVNPRVVAFADDGLNALELRGQAWPKLVDERSLVEWENRRQKLFAQAQEALEHLNTESFQPTHETWDFWRAHLGGSPKRPDFKTVILAALRRGPSELLKLPVIEMTARDWSVAFYKAITANSPLLPQVVLPDGQRVPSWVIFVALERLGFGSRIEKTITEPPQLLAGLNRARLQEDIRFNVSATPRDLRQAVAIVSNEGTESETWKPGKECAALVLRQSEIIKLANRPEQMRDLLFRWLAVDWLVFDWSGSAGQAIETAPNFDKEIQNARPLTGLSTKLLPVLTPLMVTLPAPWAAIGVPLNVDDLAARLRGLKA